MGLEQQGKENELLTFIILIAKHNKCRVKAIPPNRYIFEKYLNDQRRSEEIFFSSENDREIFRCR